ncbi:MAG: hypothetical protein JJT76_06860 [Clostridiaceae bacterium]|nr:hypothetical protein [Clostridiaceae bacterium]
MENPKDKKQLSAQLHQLKLINERSKEYLSAMELLMVDDNNSRLKDGQLRKEVENITTSINAVSESISSLENVLGR